MSDNTYEIYQQEIKALTSATAITEQIHTSQPSTKFTPDGDRWVVTPFPGVTLITPPFIKDTTNHATYIRLADIQLQLIHELGLSNIGLLPVSSFHLTVADLVFEVDYERLMQQENGESKLRDSVENVLVELPEMPAPEMRPIGLCAPGTAITVVLDFVKQSDYENILAIRRAVYGETASMLQNPRPFRAHISLLYKQYRSQVSRQHLIDTLIKTNQITPWDDLPSFKLHQIGYYYFPHMARFERQPDWPTYRFQ